jgi:hypothetical protein
MWLEGAMDLFMVLSVRLLAIFVFYEQKKASIL